MDGVNATSERDGSVRGGRKRRHMTAPRERIEVMTRGERRRRWRIEEKREIVAESLQAGVRPSEIIHRHGITSGQLYAWRQQLTRRIDGALARLGDQVQPEPSFTRVAVAPGQRTTALATEVSRAALARRSVQEPPLSAVPRSRGLIEIMLSGGVSVRVDAHVDARALSCVL